MNSRVVPVNISHERNFHRHNFFQYSLTCLILDLDEVSLLDHELRLFSLNRKNLFSLADSDYLESGPGSVKKKIIDFVARKTLTPLNPLCKVFLVTAPRVFGRVFNPVSFYFVYNPDSTFQECVVEVNNTFGDKHVYLLQRQINPGAFPARFAIQKDFHVSPFFDMKGNYLFSFADIREKLDISISLIKDSQTALKARLWQKFPGIELSDASILFAWMSRPLAPRLTYPKILGQAFKLYLFYKLPVHARPEPKSPMTIKTMKPVLPLKTRLCRNLVLNNLKKIHKGTLSLSLPDGEVLKLGGKSPGHAATMFIHDWNFFVKLVKSEDVGLGEAYTQGLWTTENLSATLELLAQNMKYMSFKENWGFIGRALHKSSILVRKMIPENTIPGSRANIQAHYDLSNDLFTRFLDKEMNYSCAVFADPAQPEQETLENAQKRKLELVASLIDLGPDDQVLDIGCGWGAFSLYAAKNYNCRVVGLTISRNQHQYLKNRIQSENLGHNVNVIMDDYRNIEGSFDKIVSIEMLEAVGHKYHGQYFKTIERLLKPGGVACIQTIAIIDQRYDDYRKTRDWISTYVFPGGLLPSLNRVCQVITDKTSLCISQVRDIGQHYPPTLAAWKSRFLENWDEIRQFGFDESFRKKWEYYFSICEAGFKTGNIKDFQIVLNRLQQ